MAIVADCIAFDKGGIWEYFPIYDILCPHCRMIMKLRDHALRILKRSGGEKDYVRIPRFQCNNKNCPVKVIRVLPEELTPYKHYTTPTIEDALDDRLDEEETLTEDGTFSPSAKAISSSRVRPCEIFDRLPLVILPDCLRQECDTFL